MNACLRFIIFRIGKVFLTKIDKTFVCLFFVDKITGSAQIQLIFSSRNFFLFEEKKSLKVHTWMISLQKSLASGIFHQFLGNLY